MKIGFYTLGMPRLPAAEYATWARKLGYEFVVFRGGPLETDGAAAGEQVFPGTSDEELDAIKQAYDEAGVGIASVHASTGRGGHLRVDSDKIDWEAETADLAAHVRVAARLGCQQIRMKMEMADRRPEPGRKWDWDDYLDNLGRASLEAVKGTTVRAVYQNHVGTASALQLIQMVERLGDSRLGVSFSPDHCIVMQENPVQLAAEHPEAIANVVMADRRVAKEDLGDFDGRYYHVRYECCMLGEGLVPMKGIFEALDRKGWDGHVYLKWERRPEPSRPNESTCGLQLPEGEVALESFLPYMASLGYTPNKQGSAPVNQGANQTVN